MFRLGRLLFIAIVAGVVYGGFYATPPGGHKDGQFDPDRLAEDEVAVWRAAAIQEEASVYTSAVVMLREQHRYSWFRAAQAAYYFARASSTFPTLNTRFERVLPDLEDAAAVQKAWVGASFDPAAVARAQLTWWVTAKLPNLNGLDQLTPLVAEELALRYGISSGMASGAAARRAEAVLLFDTGGRDPNVAAVTKILADSNRLLQHAITDPRSRAR